MEKFEKEYEACEARTETCPEGFEVHIGKKHIKQARILRMATALEKKTNRLLDTAVARR